MQILISVLRTISVLGVREARPARVVSDLPHQALAVVVICCTVGYALHAMPTTMTLDPTDANDQQQPTFSIQAVDRPNASACVSTADIPAAQAPGDGSCVIDLFGGDLLAPGATITTRFTVTGTGAVKIDRMGLRPLAGCSQNTSTTADDFCQKLHLRLTWGSRRIFDGSAADLSRLVNAPIALTSPPQHGALRITTEVSLPSTLDNRYQGLTARLPLLLTASA